MQQLSVILFGGYESYKTKLRKTFCKQQYVHSDSRIIGIQFSDRILQHQQRKIKFKIWDTPQQDRFKLLTEGYQKTCQCLIYVYEAGRQQSFEQAIQFFADSIKAGYTNKLTMLVEYVLDFNKRAIPEGKGVKFAEQNGMMFQKILDGQPTMVDKMFKMIATQIPLRESKDKIDLLFNKKMDKDKCLVEVYNLFDQVRRLSQRVSELEQFAEIEGTLSAEIDELKERIQELQLIKQETSQKLKSFDEMLKKFQVNKDIYDVISLYEKDNLGFKQTVKKIQDQFKQRCRILEQICDHIDSITFSNASAKLEQMRSAYNSYRIFNCYEESIEMVDRQASQISRISNILQGLNRSAILQFE